MNKSPTYLRVFTLVWALVGILLLAPVGSAQEVLKLKPNLQPFPASESSSSPGCPYKRYQADLQRDHLEQR